MYSPAEAIYLTVGPADFFLAITIYIIPTYINVCRDIFLSVLGGEHNVFKINSENDVDLQDILNDFINCFAKVMWKLKRNINCFPSLK